MSRYFVYTGTILLGAVLGACLVGYPIGVRNEAIKCNLVWNLNDVYSAERFASSTLSKDEVLKKIRSDALARHLHMAERIKDSYIESLLVKQSKEMQKGLMRLDSQFKVDKNSNQLK